jgi:hypothetical protein
MRRESWSAASLRRPSRQCPAEFDIGYLLDEGAMDAEDLELLW